MKGINSLLMIFTLSVFASVMVVGIDRVASIAGTGHNRLNQIIFLSKSDLPKLWAIAVQTLELFGSGRPKMEL